MPAAEEVARWFSVGVDAQRTPTTPPPHDARLQPRAVDFDARRTRGNRGQPTRCELCGTDLPREGRRKLCDACLPEYERFRTHRLKEAGRRKLAEMRASDDDPAKRDAARARSSATSRERMLTIRAWERIHGRSHDWDRYRQDVVPLLPNMTVPELVSVTGLSKHFCWQVRAGKKRLHPMHWEAVMRFAQAHRAMGE